MRIAVMGAGAVGSWFGALLARAGHALTLIGREPHVAAIRRDGLHVTSGSEEWTVHPRAGSDAALLADAELLLFCVKSTDTDSAAAAMAPWLPPTTRVLSLQNGVDNLARLEALFPGRVAAAAVYAALALDGPGRVVHRGGRGLVLAPDALPANALSAFREAGIPLELSGTLHGELWTKLILNCAWNALSAITRLPYGELWRAAGTRTLLRELVDECLAVAAAEGVQLASDPWPGVVAIAATMPAQYSSTAQDLARGRRSEIGHLNGYIVARAEAAGIPVPANRALYTLVQLLEAGSGRNG